jgi:hypothetical protein
MLTIVIENPAGTRTVEVEHVVEDTVTIRYRPCAYCARLVRVPKKTCCPSHRTLAWAINRRTSNKAVGESGEIGG